tara:strand:+ start:2330 stop:3157 length:828 start_codon:yes stop_codon:yes gene_type:complete
MRVDVWYLIGNALHTRVTLQAQLDALDVSLSAETPKEVNPCFYLFKLWPAALEERYIQLLCKYRPNSRIVVDSFVPEKYAAGKNRKARRLYAFGVNRARNECIKESFASGADYCFPLDCRHYISSAGWIKLIQDLNSQPEYGYYIMGQGQLSEGESPERDITTIDFWEGDLKFSEVREYLIGFGGSHDIKYHSALSYGQDCRTELLASLGIPGGWSKKHTTIRHSDHYGNYGKGSYAMLLPSGRKELDTNLEERRRVQQWAVSERLQEYEDLFMT